MRKIASNRLLGHGFSLFSALVWGITFVSSKILLENFSPLAILVIRFVLAYVGLWIIYPKWVKVRSLREELLFLMGGISGVSGYFLLENSAMLFTTVSNTGLILSAAPLFVAIVTHLFTKDEHFHLNLLYGFIIAMLGVGLIIFNGQKVLSVNPLGDFLAVMAGVVWAFYSLAIKKIDGSLSPVIMTRRIFFYGMTTGGILLIIFEGGVDLSPLFTTRAWLHFAFLGLMASALCFVLWNTAIRYIGAVKTSNYIYLMPVFTMAASALVLHERITGLMLMGCGLILIGVYISENGFYRKRAKA